MGEKCQFEAPKKTSSGRGPAPMQKHQKATQMGDKIRDAF